MPARRSEPEPYGELVFRRTGVSPPTRMFCMYCGGEATRVVRRKVRNPRVDPAPPAADDRDDRDDDRCRRDSRRTSDSSSGDSGGPDAGIALGGALLGGLAAFRPQPSGPPLKPDHTVVTVTTCRGCRYGRYLLRLAGPAVALLAAGVGLGFGLEWWASPDPSAADAVASRAALVGLLAGLASVGWGVYRRPPVRVTEVRRDTVTLGGVRRAYFDARRKL